MKIEEAPEQMEAMAARCETAEDVKREVSNLSREDLYKLVFSSSGEDFFQSVKGHACKFLQFADDNSLINNYETGTSRRDVILGYLYAITKVLEMSTSEQARVEMQVQTEDTQYGMRLADNANNICRQLMNLSAELIENECQYNSVLFGRRAGVHFTDNDGSFVDLQKEKQEKPRR